MLHFVYTGDNYHRCDLSCSAIKTDDNTLFTIYTYVHSTGGTGVSGLTRGLATLPPRWIQEPSVVRDKDGRPPRGPSGSGLLLCVAGVYCWELRSPWGKQIQGT